MATRAPWVIALLGVVLISACAVRPPLTPSSSVHPRPSLVVVDPDSGLPTVALAALPPEAAETMALIGAGGPYPYPVDGAGNKLGQLMPRGRAS